MDLKDYVKVDDLIKRMNEEYPEGRLVTELVNQIGDLVVFKATFFNANSGRFKFIDFPPEYPNFCLSIQLLS